mgnify:CR=1 FL=1
MRQKIFWLPKKQRTFEKPRALLDRTKETEILTRERVAESAESTSGRGNNDDKCEEAGVPHSCISCNMTQDGTYYRQANPPRLRRRREGYGRPLTIRRRPYIRPGTIAHAPSMRTDYFTSWLDSNWEPALSFLSKQSRAWKAYSQGNAIMVAVESSWKPLLVSN